jgi:phosphatidylinositol dimannoside acyltransferase
MAPTAPRRSWGRRLRGRALVAVAWLVSRLPEAPLLAIADLVGDAWYRLAPERRQLARRNLARIVGWMAAAGLGDPAARAADGDPRALNRLVRAAFRNSVRYYLRLLRAGSMSAADVERRFVVDTPGLLDDAMADPNGALFVGLHLGWYELAALYFIQQTGRRGVVPTEVVPDPELQAFLVASRERMGVHLVDVASARRELIAALRRGEPVGLVADRDLSGGGIATTFFGHPAKLPAGPALIALETGAVPRVFGTWTAADGMNHAVGRAVPIPVGGSRRERVEAWLEAIARAFEEYVAEAPEQWQSVFQPIWDDLAEVAA